MYPCACAEVQVEAIDTNTATIVLTSEEEWCVCRTTRWKGGHGDREVDLHWLGDLEKLRFKNHGCMEALPGGTVLSVFCREHLWLKQQYCSCS